MVVIVDNSSFPSHWHFDSTLTVSGLRWLALSSNKCFTRCANAASHTTGIERISLRSRVTDSRKFLSSSGNSRLLFGGQLEPHVDSALSLKSRATFSLSQSVIAL